MCVPGRTTPFVLPARWVRFGATLAAGACLGVGSPVAAAENFSSVYISEFVAVNERGLRDEDRERSGWIELHNGGSAAVNLNGWHLTDRTNDLAKWRFPGVSLLPDKYLVVFASGKNRTNNLGRLHANFRLDKEGGYLALVGPDKRVVSEYAPAYSPQSADVAYGRLLGEPALRGFFPRPTPGRPNAAGGPGFSPDVVFFQTSATFTAPLSVRLWTRSADALIRYTLDGRLPTSNSPVYAAPFLITNTTHLRARAYEKGLFPGPPRSEIFHPLHTNLLQFSSTLPVLVLDTLGQDLPASSRFALGHLSFYEPVQGRTSLTNSPNMTTRAGFHARGSSSSGLAQPGFAVQFLDEFNNELHRPVLGLPADSDWVLYAPNVYEPVLIHNPFVHQLSRDLGRYSPRTRFLEVFLVRGTEPVSSQHYHGLYVLEEKIKVGKNRVNIDRLGPEDLKPPEVTGGYLLKIDRTGPGEGGFSAGGASMVHVEPKESVISQPQRAPQREYLNTFFNDFDRALNGPAWKDPVAGYRAYIDAEAWIDWHVLEVLSGNVDSVGLSTYFHKPRRHGIVFGPHWDFDRALGSTDGRDDNPRQWNTGPFFGGAWWPRLFSDPDFWQLWVDRWQELRRTHFSLTNLYKLVDRLTDEVREAQPRQVARWNLQPRGGSYQSEINLMKAWLSNRIDFIDQQLPQPPRLGQEGGPVPPGFLLTLSGPAKASLYYTLDGSDPRLAQGTISSNALLYAGPIPLNRSVRLVARVRDPNVHQTGGPPSSTPWSGPVKGEFVITRK